MMAFRLSMDVFSLLSHLSTKMRQYPAMSYASINFKHNTFVFSQIILYHNLRGTANGRRGFRGVLKVGVIAAAIVGA